MTAVHGERAGQGGWRYFARTHDFARLDLGTVELHPYSMGRNEVIGACAPTANSASTAFSSGSSSGAPKVMANTPKASCRGRQGQSAPWTQRPRCGIRMLTGSSLAVVATSSCKLRNPARDGVGNPSVCGVERTLQDGHALPDYEDYWLCTLGHFAANLQAQLDIANTRMANLRAHDGSSPSERNHDVPHNTCTLPSACLVTACGPACIRTYADKPAVHITPCRGWHVAGCLFVNAEQC